MDHTAEAVRAATSPPSQQLSAKRQRTVPTVDSDAALDRNSIPRHHPIDASVTASLAAIMNQTSEQHQPHQQQHQRPADSDTMVASQQEAPQLQLQVKRLSSAAKLPTRGSAFAAGYDLYASRDCVIPARSQTLVDTDISIACPAGTYGRVAARSGLATKHSIDVGAGVIDADYRGPVKVLLFNFSNDKEFEVKVGDRIAQLVLERIYTPEVVEVQELEESVRGAGGFGSTGK